MLKTKIFFLIGVLFFSFGLSFGLTNFEGRESFKENLQKNELQEIPQSSWENFLDYGNSYAIYYETEGKDVIDWSFLGDPIFVGITVMAMDLDEYWNYLNDWSYSSYLLSNGSTHVDSGSFIVPYSDTWYIVFLNNDTDTTTTYLVFNAASTYNDFGGTRTDYGEWYYLDYSGGILESGTVDWAFEGSNTDIGITPMAMDDYNYGQFVGGYSYTPYFLTPGPNYTDSGTFT
ncbi:MAG: hypothetical protein KAR20_25960, partial [Candidatus Heimdallarchaeota archaeon]|nr:hypothetical protein [Candidatus Heimdallarchaeota archaeon]